MKLFLKKFIFRGVVFSSGGPLIYSIVLLILDLCNVNVMCDGITIFKGVFSTFLLAFIVAGVSVIWQEERLGVVFAILIHGTTLYLCYLGMYLFNGWLASDITTIVWFSFIFIGSYFIICLIVYLCERNRAKRLNEKLNNR